MINLTKEEYDKYFSVDCCFERVEYMLKSGYGVSASDVCISNVKGYFRDRHEKIHENHPIHGCLFCSGPFRATYSYYDYEVRLCGKFISPCTTWKVLRDSGKFSLTFL